MLLLKFIIFRSLQEIADRPKISMNIGDSVCLDIGRAEMFDFG
jgi:hypothetical protein